MTDIPLVLWFSIKNNIENYVGIEPVAIGMIDRVSIWRAT